MKGKKMEVQAIIEHLRKERENETIEGNLLKTKMVRELYKELGDPKEEDFPEEFKIAGTCWKKHAGYTKWLEFKTEMEMHWANTERTDWYIKRPSQRKVEIVEEYIRAGWHCRVQSFNVICTRYVKHPKYENLWVEFYSSRDCNKYQYVIEEE